MNTITPTFNQRYWKPIAITLTVIAIGLLAIGTIGLLSKNFGAMKKLASIVSLGCGSGVVAITALYVLYSYKNRAALPISEVSTKTPEMTKHEKQLANGKLYQYVTTDLGKNKTLLSIVVRNYSAAKLHVKHFTIEGDIEKNVKQIMRREKIGVTRIKVMALVHGLRHKTPIKPLLLKESYWLETLKVRNPTYDKIGHFYSVKMADLQKIWEREDDENLPYELYLPKAMQKGNGTHEVSYDVKMHHLSKESVGNIPEGEYLYILDCQSKFQLIPKLNNSHLHHHSSMSKGGAVLYAGEIRIKDKKVAYLDNDSGHYKPPASHKQYALQCLVDQGIPTSFNPPP